MGTVKGINAPMDPLNHVIKSTTNSKNMYSFDLLVLNFKNFFSWCNIAVTGFTADTICEINREYHVVILVRLELGLIEVTYRYKFDVVD